MRILRVFLLLLGLWLPAAGQDWTTFEQLMEQKSLQRAYASVEGWPTGPDRDLAQAESHLSLGRPDLAWDIVTRISLKTLPPRLRARFFLFRGRLQELQAEYKLARKDFAQGLREKPLSRIKAQILEQQVALYLKLDDVPRSQAAMDGFVDLPDQAEFALQAASKRSLKEGRGSESLAILRLFQQQAENQDSGVRAAYFRLQEVEALWQMGRPHRAYRLARKLEESSELRQDSHLWLTCLLRLEYMSREVREHRESALALMKSRVEEFSDPLSRTRLMLTLEGKKALPKALAEARKNKRARPSGFGLAQVG